jgi:hypothetical protein
MAYYNFAIKMCVARRRDECPKLYYPSHLIKGWPRDDGLISLHRRVVRALQLAKSTARPVLNVRGYPPEIRESFRGGFQVFKHVLWWLKLKSYEGWLLMPAYERRLARAAGGVVTACGVRGTSAHELVLRLSDRIVYAIVGTQAMAVVRRNGFMLIPVVERYVRNLSRMNRKDLVKEFEEIRKRVPALEDEFDGLWHRLRSEYFVAESGEETAIHEGCETPEPPQHTLDRKPASGDAPVQHAAGGPHPPDATDTEADKPHWDSDRRELWFRGQLCKRFRQPAPNQVYVLKSFEELAWQAKTDDPLPPSPHVDRRERLADTVRALNSNDGIHFELDGTGKGILWAPASKITS